MAKGLAICIVFVASRSIKMLIIWLLISDIFTLRALSKSVSWLFKAVIL
ncbi:Uncharacterised protein [Vibrio cholerae]|nr:Uncharacterised protein [Vibrio cholerae]